MSASPVPANIDSLARLAWARLCRQRGRIYDEPGDVTVDGDTATLSNVNGVLARLRWNGRRFDGVEPA